jgi:hypothetical protein
MYTLKLDWTDERVKAVRHALMHADPPVFANPEDRARYRDEAAAALADIDLYRSTTAEVKASLTTETTGYCMYCGEFITLVNGQWLDTAHTSQAIPMYLRGYCPRNENLVHNHVKADSASA